MTIQKRKNRELKRVILIRANKEDSISKRNI